MRISEIFFSLQGEGTLVGVPSIFIRTSGCNLRCTWCDTDYASWHPQGTEMSVAEIVDRVTEFACLYVVLTGGEPLIMPEVEELTRQLRELGYHITIETAGTIWKDIAFDLASVSPKLSNSTPWEREDGRRADQHEASRLNRDVLCRFIRSGAYQLKFVVDTPEDLEEIDGLVFQLSGCEPDRVILMPQGVTKEELDARNPWIVEHCRQRGYRYSPRLHIMLFGNTPGT
jgi:7-carboxy-7-deazaguanine synthase